ncbi:hypothetical protein V3C99_005098 [Haemonchus contortus]|uniref:Ovule protein n=1 Tax=Haemonchus contortus TaxID=6289 RepID=A0A7I5E5J4_HAECO
MFGSSSDQKRVIKEEGEEHSKAKKRMIAELMQEVNALGVARRSERQVDQKIKDEIKKIKEKDSCTLDDDNGDGRKSTGDGREEVTVERNSEWELLLSQLQDKELES